MKIIADQEETIKCYHDDDTIWLEFDNLTKLIELTPQSALELSVVLLSHYAHMLKCDIEDSETEYDS